MQPHKLEVTLMITRHLVTLMFLALVLSFVGPRAGAQQSAAVQGISVNMVVGVEPKHGDEIPTITQQDMMVYQGHDRQPVTGWVPAMGKRAGLALAILIDYSAGPSLGTQLNDIRTFIGQQAPTTLIAIGYMQNGTVALAQNFTQDHKAAAKSLRLTQGFSGVDASPYIAISDFIKRWPSSDAIPRREILAITSGIDSAYVDSFPNPYTDTAIQDAQCGGVLVYSIYTPSAGHFGHSYYRSYWGQNYLSQLSEMTGGESYYLSGPQAPVAFAPYLNQLNRQLSNQFLLTFLAKPQKKAGTEPVKLTSEIRSVDFVHSSRVCVPASQ
jgi:hypothetical protein